MIPGLELLQNFYRRHRRLAVLAVVVAAGGAGFAWFSGGGPAEVQYFTAPVEQGDILAVVNATGTINAVTTVQVGTQVSGMVAELSADFNSRVRKGQVIARIDPAIFQTRVLQAEADLASAEAGVKSLDADLAVANANLERERAALREAELRLKRTRELHEQGIASVQERDTVEVAHESAAANVRAAEAQLNQIRARREQQRAQVKQRQAQLEQARLDLQHTIIRTPVDGTVIARNVDAGQTVAASLQAPTLFTIAEDLSQMLVYARTDESDVGKIRVGAEANFKVDSFPLETFRGRVKQVRMNAYQVQNVVTYDTIIEFENPDVKLLPGMTAYVTIPVARATAVVKIPNGALRFVPDVDEQERMALLRQHNLLGPPPGQGGDGTARADESRPGEGGAAGESPEAGQPRSGMSEEDRARMRERWQSMSSEERARFRAMMMARRQQAGGEGAGGFQGPPRSGPEAEGAYQIVWKLNPDGSLQPVRVKTGLTDYTFTAMLEGSLKPGDRLVIGQTGGLSQQTAQPFGRPMRF
ncbi:MAG: efflux RND transporter periplasmic adaptor subunit [Acidobacteria bacterium]|nr:efflux RND transporter periplasmic adaptor subunit [Acidobacteriota bacterium]